MINKYLHILICLMILLLGMSFVPPATADNNPPSIPNIFTGTVKINEENAPIGIEVQAYIGSILAGSALVEGAGEYGLLVRGASTDEGKLITFMVGNLTATETQVYYHETSPRKLDLTIVDNEAPETTANAPEDWQNSSFTVTLSASNNTGDYVLNATFFKLDEGPFEIGDSVEINEDGNHSITYYSDYLAGNVEAAKTVYAKLDTVAPVSSDDVPDGWQTSSFTVTFYVDDLTPKTTFFKLDEGPFEIGNSVEINEDGNHSITYYSDDLAGNVETEKTVYAKLDTSALETTIDVPEGWQNSSFTVTLSAIDNTGDSFLNATFFKLDEGPFEIGNSVEINEDGNHSITYYSDDLAGNVETAKTVYAKLDTVTPVTSDDAPEGRQLAPFWVNFTATDADPSSGINDTFYRFEGYAEWNARNSIHIEDDGVYKIYYYTEDNAGNREAAKNVTVNLDMAAPVLEDLAPVLEDLKAVPVSILNNSVDTSIIGLNVTDPSETGITNVTINLTSIGGDSGVEMSSSDGLKYMYGITTNLTGEFEFIVTATNDAGKSDFDTVNVTVRTEDDFVGDYTSGDGNVTHGEVEEVMDKYRDGNVSAAVAAAVVEAAYPTTYNDALALLGLVD